MNKFMQGAVLALGLVTLGVAQARSDVRDGNAMIQPVKGDKYSIDGATMGKAELYGYIGDLRDRERLTGLVLKRGGDDEQRHVIGSIARTLQLKAFEQDGGDLKPIDLPAAAPTPPPPPIDGKPQTAAAPPPATDPATPAH
ncbi:MAG: hypothetical protein ACHP7D_09285 [Lysobacterales bacterium]